MCGGGGASALSGDVPGGSSTSAVAARLRLKLPGIGGGHSARHGPRHGRLPGVVHAARLGFEWAQDVTGPQYSMHSARLSSRRRCVPTKPDSIAKNPLANNKTHR